MVEWRRFLHRNPELSYHERKTSQFVAGKLRELGLAVSTEVGGGYGVVGVLEGGKPGKTVALRADMDALPIQDEKHANMLRGVAGVMHACGHDGHTSTLLGVAAYFSRRQADVEEGDPLYFPAGGRVCPGAPSGMIDAGVLDVVDVIYGSICGRRCGRDGGKRAGTAHGGGGRIVPSTSRARAGDGGMPHVTVDSVVAGAAVVGEPAKHRQPDGRSAQACGRDDRHHSGRQRAERHCGILPHSMERSAPSTKRRACLSASGLRISPV
ncbi:M20/M25/M40 family metallo-hydrolase [Paenibacillus sp. JTLBN-2024]